MRSPLVFLSLIGAAAVYTWFNGLKYILTAVTGSSYFSGWAIVATGLLLACCAIWFQFPSLTLFVWHCFLAPLGESKDQQSRLDKFYEGQAQVYDKTRSGLLRGRKTMLNMSAAHLRVMRENNPEKRLVWVDVGGGTGWNIETMDAYFPISQFDAVYLVDLCKPLLDIAEARFRARGWKNVTCICQDASSFWLPEWNDGIHPKGSVGFATLSYSLSMIPSYHTLLDRIDYLLCPEQGLLSVVDFYTAGKTSSLHEKAIGGESKKCGFLSRWFWQMWFDLDHVDLSSGRRNYLEYRFGTVKSYNGRNKFVVPLIVRIPYYIWLGCSRARDTSRFTHAFEVESGNMIGTPVLSPVVPAAAQITEMGELDLGPSALATSPPEAVVINVSAPLSSFHYQLKHTWRLPYFETSVHSQFRTFIYSFTWEDPEVDLKHLQLGESDTVFCIASAGDNVLHYAINARPHRIHAVDMNPCQGHLVELKLAALKALEYDDFFSLFGEGKMSLPKFRGILDGKLSPYLSSAAYQFWRINASAFEQSFYLRGYSGWALRLTQWLLKLNGLTSEMKALCEAKTIEEQDRIWKSSLRKIFVEGRLVRMIVNSPVFLWNALGVPQTQKAALTKEGSVNQFLRETLDPIGSHALLSKGAYHYLLCLLGQYSRESCPDYLTPRGFNILHENTDSILDSFRLHTDSIMQVLSGLSPGSITRMVVMDHLDWFEPEHKEALAEIAQMHRVLPKSGMVFWRSAAKYPWYNSAFERAGFRLTPLGIREGPEKAIDRVNMYASFWRARKI